MTAIKTIACTLFALPLTLFAGSAHAIFISGTGFVPNGPGDVSSITYAQGAVTNMDLNNAHVVVADMGGTTAGRLDLSVYILGTGASKSCTIDTRNPLTGVANSYQFGINGVGGTPQLLSGTVTNLGTAFLAVSLRCVLPQSFSGNQTYIFFAQIAQTTH